MIEVQEALFEVEAIKSSFEFNWNEFILFLKDLIGEKSFQNWFLSAELISFRASHLTFSVSNEFAKKWIEDNYRSYILTASHKYLARTFEIVVKAKEEEEQAVEVKPNENYTIFDDKYTFSNFVVGSSNEIAYAAAFSIAESEAPNKRSNPLYIYGNVGLGKTHLMYAIGHHMQKKYPKRKVLYLSAEKFVHLFVQSLIKNTDEFRTLLRSIDVLMIDDIQFICGKNKSQEEFFNTFNILLENAKQIIVSCDRPPADLDKIEDRLRSRLAWGLMVDVHETNYELRLGILRSKIQNLNIYIEEPVLEFLAENIDSNIRELEGGLNKVIMYADLMKKKINLHTVKSIMKDVIKQKKDVIRIEDIQAKVAHYYKTNLKDILSTSRKKSFVKSRQVAMYLAKKLTNHSLLEISKAFDKKDHTTVLHAIQTVKEWYENDEDIRVQIDELIDIIN